MASLLAEGWGSRKAQKRKRIRQRSKVYFIREGGDGPVKIGVSSWVEKRLRTLQTANSEELFLLGVIVGDEKVETEIHKRFEKYLKRGEWYYPDPKLLGEIRTILERGYL